MSTHHVKAMVDGQPTFAKPLPEILSELRAGGALKVLSPIEYHTDRQRRWFKGILLKSLSDDNGESTRQWESKLITAIFPEDVQYVSVNNQVFANIPSITRYGKKKMIQLIEESVPMCHEWGFAWVTYPDEELRS